MKTTLEFVEYSGRYPNLCSGRLFVRINGFLVSFGREWYGSKTDDTDVPNYPSFWHSSGSAGVDDNGEEFCTEGDWHLDTITLKKSSYPERIFKLLPRLIKLMNKHVKHGCCGGCI